MNFVKKEARNRKIMITSILKTTVPDDAVIISMKFEIIRLVNYIYVYI